MMIERDDDIDDVDDPWGDCPSCGSTMVSSVGMGAMKCHECYALYDDETDDEVPTAIPRSRHKTKLGKDSGYSE